MSRRFLIPLLTAAFLGAAVAFVLTVDSAFAAVNYNSSKSNTGMRTISALDVRVAGRNFCQRFTPRGGQV